MRSSVLGTVGNAQQGCRFARDLEGFGDAIAVVTEWGERISYARLAARADAFSARLGPRRRLVVVEATNALEPLVAYLGALRGGHPVILAAAEGDHGRLRDAFRPSARFARRDGAWRLDLNAPADCELHPDLAVLLSTSGTTGATKLVRLSGAAVDANARSIAEYLGVSASDRAITSLPFHYSYGLSVVNSHLAVGGALLLTARSVVDLDFLSFLRDEGATSLAGVPYTYELMERIGFRDKAPASLRTLTQAGGRLPPDAVRRFAGWAESHGARFFVMYGQTEATARMAYLPPEAALEHPDAIGRAIPGGEFRLVDEAGRPIEQDDAVGELVYRGPNVMMGYATAADDLARGAELDELHTGDLARRGADGLYRIVGRKSRFAKIFGLRVSLDEVDAQLGRLGAAGATVSDDARIYVALTRGPPAGTLAETLAETYDLPQTVFQVTETPELPTLPSGKVDYQAILREGQARAEAGAAAPATTTRHAIEAAFARAFPRRGVRPPDTFVSLGGDSLNYVMISLEIEKALGFLPEDWEQLSIAQLCALSARRLPTRWWSLRSIETEVILRALAVIAVVVAHSSDLLVGGGAEVLLALAGYNLARYQKSRLAAGQGLGFTLSFARRIIAPYYVLLVAYLTFKREFDVASLLLVSNFFGRFRSLIEPFWFLEVMLQCFLIVSLLALFKPVQRMIAANPWRLGLLWLAASVVLKGGVYALAHHDVLLNRTPDAALHLLALGWCAHEATTRGRRVVMTILMLAFAALAVVGIPGFWPHYPYPGNLSHAAWMAACAMGLLWVRRQSLPVILHVAFSGTAAASFYIYLTHVFPVWLFYWSIGDKSLTTNVAASMVVGLAAYWTAGRISARIERRRAARAA